jgi:hypothetical protein
VRVGTIYHARNLDWSFPGLPNMTYTARFMSQGQLQYYTTAFIGAILGYPSCGVRLARGLTHAWLYVTYRICWCFDWYAPRCVFSQCG